MDEIAIVDEAVMDKIYIIRGQKVMLDYDLARMYAVETKQLKRQVKRNIERFPEDFMFELSTEEQGRLRSQIGTLDRGRGEYSKYLPMAFTEQGVAMLSSVLNNPLAIKVNIQIIRIFTRMREMWLSNQEVLLKLEQLDRKVEGHDEEIQKIFEYLKELLNPQIPRKMIGFKAED